MSKVCIIQGPNLNMLGQREPSLYGKKTLEEIHAELKSAGAQLGLEVECFQSNHEGEIVEKIQKCGREAVCLIINAAAFTHTSVAIRDALLAVAVPAIEVHISNIFAREEFRHKSLLSDIAAGLICGFGVFSYHLALQAAANLLAQRGDSV